MASITSTARDGTAAGASEGFLVSQDATQAVENARTPRSQPHRSRRGTDVTVDEQEKGDAKAKDHHDATGPLHDSGTTTDAAIATRRAVASNLARAIGGAISACASAKMPARLQLLKRELSHCHDALGELTTEADFLSIVTLIEMELGSRDWKTITKDELLTLQRAARVGANQAVVTFDDYEAVLRTLHHSGYTPGPSLSLDGSELPVVEDFDAEPNG